MPKEIISGDFYWTTKINGHTIIAVADCTGHGVPGAFMSMLGITLLNKIVNERSITDPANILNRLRIDVINSLRQTGKDEETKDGMDISLLKINEEKTKITFAAAMNSSFIIRDRQITELKADSMPIGIHYNAFMPFTQKEFEIKKNDCIYMFTDGFSDQFGGKNYRKYKLSRFKELLIEVCGQNLEQQKKTIIEKHNKWKGNEEQVDDILILGLKI